MVVTQSHQMMVSTRTSPVEWTCQYLFFLFCVLKGFELRLCRWKAVEWVDRGVGG
jgi:hypothetical protein